MSFYHQGIEDVYSNLITHQGKLPEQHQQNINDMNERRWYSGIEEDEPELELPLFESPPVDGLNIQQAPTLPLPSNEPFTFPIEAHFGEPDISSFTLTSSTPQYIEPTPGLRSITQPFDSTHAFRVSSTEVDYVARAFATSFRQCTRLFEHKRSRSSETPREPTWQLGELNEEFRGIGRWIR